jgi:hypothetical protein
MTTTLVKKSDNLSTIYHGAAGGTITPGDAVWQDVDGTIKRADNTTTGGNPAKVMGIALNGAAINQVVSVLMLGNLDCDGLTKGTAYFLSANAGKICPFADLTAGKYVTFIGIALSATQLKVDPVVSGVTL